MHIFFSIIIPVYNRKQFLKPVINSVLKQTYSQFELLIVDDGSSDNAGEYIASEFKDERIKYFFKKNEERGAARNYGLEKAKGSYAVFLDSDDVMEDNYLAVLADIIKEHPNQVFFATKYDFELPDGKRLPSSIQPLKEGFYDFNFFLKGNVLACNFCIKIIDSNYKKFPPERELASMEDWLFVLLNTQEQPLFLKDIICVHMNEHEGRSMANNKVVIKARRRATEWVLKNISLSTSQQKILKTWSHYFCGIHEYVENNRKNAIRESLSAIRISGMNSKFLVLLLKSIVGRKLISKYK